MRLRVSTALPRGGALDLLLACDATATAGDVARVLVRCGFGSNARIEQAALSGGEPLTLCASPGAGGAWLLLDPLVPIIESGLQSGWFVEAVLEFDGPGARLVEPAAFVEVLSGEQRGVLFSLIFGDAVIGRDPSCRVRLLDRSISRRHAEISIDASGGIAIRDLGSANGVLVDGAQRTELRIAEATRVRLGEVSLRIVPGPPTSAARPYPHRALHTRSPLVLPRFPERRRELPSPPARPQPARVPMIAMLAPMLMGGAMYAVTRSPMSLMMIAFSPAMMIGSWLDGALGGHRRHRRDLARFAEELAEERRALTGLRAREIEVRATESPTLEQLRDAIEHRSELLWTRRPEHRSFLEVRLGDGTLPSRTELAPPPRGEASNETWALLQRLVDEFELVEPVPVIERFDRCGSIGVSGARDWAEGVAASLVLQLAALHSPDELVIACFASAGHREHWEWVKWLPQVDPVASPLGVWPLADSDRGCAALLNALEALLEQRSSSGRSGARIRSHLDADARNDAAQGEPVGELPTLPAVVVLVLEGAPVDIARLTRIMERGPDHGVHVVWAAGHRSAVPGACRTLIDLSDGRATAHFVRSGAKVPLSRIESVDPALAMVLARALAPVEDSAARALDESDLPRTVHLRDLRGAGCTDLLGGPDTILRAWEHGGSLVSRWRPGEERAPIDLATIVGQGPNGPVAIDLRTHGPHALVGGTTGAGKSEFLQSWIMGMAARVSPERLTLLLVDYKGGAAFAECVDLPHTVGLVTDLGPHLVRRALTSLRAELRHREELLAAHDAKDLISMERRSDIAAPPLLVIVIDEFAALAREVPEFVDGVIDIAQRGRSLGLHLIMATQRPAGVITDNLRANTNLRVALRMADEADSVDVIGAADAARFDAEMPGRGAVKIGPGRLSHFQTGYLGGRASRTAPPPSVELRTLDFAEGEPWPIPPEPDAARGARLEAGEPRDIERLRDSIAAAARAGRIARPRRPWLDELPDVLPLDALRSAADGGGRPAIGMLDDPAAQAQRPVALDLEGLGNLAFIGAGGTGKTSALISLAAGMSADVEDDPVQLYAIDAAGGALSALEALPTVGAVASLADAERTERVLRRLVETISERGPRFAAARASGLAAYRGARLSDRADDADQTDRADRADRADQPDRAASADDTDSTHSADAVPSPLEPRIVLLLDGFSAFRQASEARSFASGRPMELLDEIMRHGRAVGVHVAMTADRPSAIPVAMVTALQRRFVLRLANPSDYDALGVPADAFDEAPPGRAVISGDDRAVQIAVAVPPQPSPPPQSPRLPQPSPPPQPRAPSSRSGTAAPAAGAARPDLASQSLAIDALAAELRARGVASAPEIVNAPALVPLEELPSEHEGRPVFGIDTGSFAPATLPERGLGLLAGPSGAGLSQAALSCVDALERCSENGIDSVLLTFAETGLRQAREWGATASGAREIERLVGRLVLALGGRTPDAGGSALGAASLTSDGIGAGIFGDVADASDGLETMAADTGDADPPLEFPSRGRRGVIVVERPAEAERTAALPGLVALAKAARRADALVLFEFETGTAGSIWDLHQALKQPTWGLALQPDAGEPQLPFREDLGRVKRADFPPGRGFAIEAGRVVPVQVARLTGERGFGGVG